MSEESLSNLVERLSELAPPGRPAPGSEIKKAEQRLQIRLSDDFRFVYERLNGTRESTDPDHGWIRLWRLDQWYPVEDELGELSDSERRLFDDISSAVVFADYSLESWHYVAKFHGSSREVSTPIYLLHLKPYLVASSLGGFLNSALVDGPEIYPRD